MNGDMQNHKLNVIYAYDNTEVKKKILFESNSLHYHQCFYDALTVHDREVFRGKIYAKAA
jgi:hypothetical protein